MPEYLPLDLRHDPLFARALPERMPAECAQANNAARKPVTLGAHRGLGQVAVAASDFARNRPRDAATHRVRIEGCALSPPIVTMMRGDRLVVENHDDFPFAPLYGAAYSPKPLKRGQKLFVPTWAGSLEPLLCSSDAPCGRTDVYVFHHPVHAVTGQDGQFRIDGFPAGEMVRITALHPLFEPSETTVWVEPGAEVRIELLARPRERFLPVAAPPRP
jgi:hypothetical protein